MKNLVKISFCVLTLEIFAPAFALAASAGGAPLSAYFLNFAIYVALAVFLFKKFASPLLRARKTNMVNHLQSAGLELNEAENKVSLLRGRLSNINAEEEQVLKSFDEEAKRMVQVVRESGERQVEKIVEDTENQIQHELRRAKLEIRREVVKLATAQAMAELQRGLSDDADRKIRKDALNSLLAN